VLEAIGLDMRDLFPPRTTPPPSPPPPRRIVATYPYHDEDGKLLFEAVRYEPKDFRQRRPDGNGDWTWSVKGVLAVPYRLPELVEAVRAGRHVFVVEGEKDADTMLDLGLVATCNAGGSGKWTAEHSECLRGARVVILPDHDEPGQKHAREVAESLRGIAAEVRVLELPGLAPKGDVSDWLDAGGTVEALKELARAAPLWTPDAAVLEKEADEWPEPREIPSGLASVEPFDPRLLPESLCPWIQDISERIGCPPDFPAVAAVVGLASVVGGKVTIRPSRRDDWTVTPNLWGAPIGRPGVLKSPAVEEALKPLKRLEIDAAEEHGRELAEWKALQDVLEVKRGTDRDKLRKQLKSNGDPQAIARTIAERRGEAGEDAPEPPRRRYLVNDTTVERLQEILAANPSGTLAYRDELVGLLRSLEKEGREDARAFYLEAWNGGGRYESNRIGRGDTIVPRCTLSLLGNIQPGPLRDYLKGASAGGGGADGLVQRFQLAVWPDIAGKWSSADRWPDTEARDTAFKTFERLARLDPEKIGGERDKFASNDEPPFLRFDDAAQEVFIEWRVDLERRVRSGEEHPALESHLAKYRSLVPSLALLFHLADKHTGPVGERSLMRSLAWAQYLESHARRMYGAVTGADAYPARCLAKRIRAGEVEDGFRLRDVYQNGWTGLSTRDEAAAAAEVLESLDWLRPEEQATGGRPTMCYRINPGVEGSR
jgi:putative DNA primase/helicase